MGFGTGHACLATARGDVSCAIAEDVTLDGPADRAAREEVELIDTLTEVKNRS